MKAQEQKQPEMKRVKVIEHDDGTYSIPLSSFTVKKPAYGENFPKIVTCRVCVPIDKSNLLFSG